MESVLHYLTIFSNGFVNGEETSDKALIGVRPEGPILMPFQSTIARFWHRHAQPVMLNTSKGGTDLKKRKHTITDSVKFFK